MNPILTLRPLAMCLVLALAACGGGGGGTAATTATTTTTPTTAGKLTISESYNTTSGDLDFSAATGTNSAETVTGGDSICAIRLSKVSVGTSKDNFEVNLYFKQSDKSVYFVGIINITNIIAFNMTTNTDAEKAKIKIDTATKTATFTDVLLKSNENPANKAKINGNLTFIGSTTAACGT